MSVENDENCLLHKLIEQFKIEYNGYTNKIGIQSGGNYPMIRALSAEVNNNTKEEPTAEVQNRPMSAPSQQIQQSVEIVVSNKEKKDKIIDEIIELQDKYTDLCHFQTALIENNVNCNTTENSKNILSTVALVIEAICSEIQSKNKQFTELPKE
jgi:hypothetical protein